MKFMIFTILSLVINSAFASADVEIQANGDSLNIKNAILTLDQNQGKCFERLLKSKSYMAANSRGLKIAAVRVLRTDDEKVAVQVDYFRTSANQGNEGLVGSGETCYLNTL